MESRIRSVIKSQNEIQKRQYLGTEAKSYGRGGLTAVSKASGVSHTTIRRGMREVEAGLQYEPGGRIRGKGGGRKKIIYKYPNIREDIISIVKDATYGDPETTKIWTNLSLRKIAKVINERSGIKISHVSIGKTLEDLGYSLQKNKKMDQVGKESEFRNEQFEIINEKINEFIDNGDPVISVDCKKKEVLGNYKNNGAEYRKKGDPRSVLDHDFPDPELGKAVPYGVYDIRNNVGFISLGNSADTAEFAANSIELWWENYGKFNYKDSEKILITCDSGGSNGCNVRLWKREMGNLSTKIGMDIYVVHYPTGTSKYNKIEHRLFSQISKNWQGKPLTNLESTKKYIESTTTTTGLKVSCMIDSKKYTKGIKVSDKEFNSINIIHSERLGKWNYHFYKQSISCEI